MFLLSQNDENQSENGSKNSKIRLRARPPAEPQKKMLQTKKLRSKSWKTQGFYTFRLPILDGRVHEQVSSVLFFTVFFEGERHDLSKTGGFGRIMGPPPPGKPVTFYECHPDDHAPAPSVRADLFILHVFCMFVRSFFGEFGTCGIVSRIGPKVNSLLWIYSWRAVADITGMEMLTQLLVALVCTTHSSALDVTMLWEVIHWLYTGYTVVSEEVT